MMLPSNHARTLDRAIPIVAIIVVAGIAFACRLPWRDAPIQTDVGIWAYHGWRINQGATLYRDLWENKPPGIFYTFAWIERFADVRTETVLFWLDPLLTLAICAAIYRAARAVAGPIPSALAIVPACIVLSHRVLADWGLNTEKFAALFEAMAIGLVLRLPAMTAAKGSGVRTALAAGALIGVATAYKQTGIILMPLVVAWLLMNRQRPFRATLGACVVAGFALVWAFIAAWLASQGSLRSFWDQVVSHEFLRVSSTDQDAGLIFTWPHAQFVLNQLWLASILLLPAAAGLVLLKFLQPTQSAAGVVDLKESRVALPLAHALAICFVFAMVPVSYGHYLLQAVPGAAIGLAWVLHRVMDARLNRRLVVAFIVVAIIPMLSLTDLASFVINPDHDARVSYRRLSTQRRELVEAIRANNTPNESVLVWPVDMAASFEARRITPLEMCQAISLFNGKLPVLEPPMPVVTRYIESHPPEVIIDWSPIGVEQPEGGGEPVLLTPASGLSLTDPPDVQHSRAEGRAVAPLKQWIRANYGGQVRSGNLCTILPAGVSRGEVGRTCCWV